MKSAAPLPTDEIDPHKFEPTEEGSGAFGRWMLDAYGLPAYRYEMNQRRDPRAYYINSEGRDRRDHWHQIGNDRITGLASNDGVIQVYSADRGGIFANRWLADAFDPPRTLIGYLDAIIRALVELFGRLRNLWLKRPLRKTITPRGATNQVPISQPATDNTDRRQYAFTGGFGYLNDGDQTWATAFRYCPPAAETQRIFGIGYFETAITYRDIRQTRRVYVPYGQDASYDYRNDPTLLIDVEIENRHSTAIDLHYYEYWDVNVQQMRVEWLRTGLAAPLGDSRRYDINQRFTPEMAVQADGQLLRFHQQHDGGPLAYETSGNVDATPPDIFLTNLGAPAAAYYIDKRAFFGNGGVRSPETISKSRPGTTTIPIFEDFMPYCMVLRHDLRLQPGETVHLRYAYGMVQPTDQKLDFLDKYRSDDWFQQTRNAWKVQLAYFSTSSDPVLQRETTWHSYQLLSATLYSEYYATHYMPQGATYLYLHGADGVPRDQGLFVLPMVYLRPDLARQTLKLIMSLRDADSLALPYAFTGNGAHANADGLHKNPSDLDLFFLLAISEYLAATGDRDFLHNVKIPLYRPPSEHTPGDGITVLDHIRAAVKHLDAIGIGAHKLLNIGDGDWDDAIIIQNIPLGEALPFKNFGESVPNSQMALYVLPLVANLIEPDDPGLAVHLRAMVEILSEGVKQQWNKEATWFQRALLRGLINGDDLHTIGDHHISLQAQPWPLISGLAAEMGIEAELIMTVKGLLDDPSPTGAMLETAGQVWPAISQLLTWGYRRSRPDLAWRSLNRHTFAVHAMRFPNVWFNIWTGPDGTNSSEIPNPGGTWASPVTPMTDFPALNANQDTMALLGLLRVCGIEPSKSGDGLDIAPKAPPERFVLDTQLLRLEVAPQRIAGIYRPIVTGSRILHIYLLETATHLRVKLNGEPLDVLPQKTTSSGLRVDLLLNFEAKQAITFEIIWE